MIIQLHSIFIFILLWEVYSESLTIKNNYSLNFIISKKLAHDRFINKFDSQSLIIFPQQKNLLKQILVSPQSLKLYGSSSYYHTSFNDTIFAVSSGYMNCKSALSIIRISGNLSQLCLDLLLKPSEKVLTPISHTINSRFATLKTLYCPVTGEPIDKAIVLIFRKPFSYTGEDLVELHVHGSIAVIETILNSLSGLNEIFKKFQPQFSGTPKIRIAEAGEFTRRAFVNKKMGITQIEGTSDLLESTNLLQSKQALRQILGYHENVFETWKKELIALLARSEAIIDFGEDKQSEINEKIIIEDIHSNIKRLTESLQKHLDDKKGQIIRDGINVTLLGPPNVGKSTLMNLLSKDSISIVGPVKGTTRDRIKAKIKIGNINLNIVDTAGIRNVKGVSSNFIIEQEGIKRSLEALDSSHFVIVVFEPKRLQKQIEEFSKILYKNSFNETSIQGLYIVLNKMDLVENLETKRLRVLDKKLDQHLEAFFPSKLLNLIRNRGSSMKISNKMEDSQFSYSHFSNSLVKKIKEDLSLDSINSQDHYIVTRERHKKYLKTIIKELSYITGCFLPMEIISEHIRNALNELGKIMGTVDSEEVLEVIFKEFCIGK